MSDIPTLEIEDEQTLRYHNRQDFPPVLRSAK
jgi:hypothetical protein